MTTCDSAIVLLLRCDCKVFFGTEEFFRQLADQNGQFDFNITKAINRVVEKWSHKQTKHKLMLRACRPTLESIRAKVGKANNLTGHGVRTAIDRAKKRRQATTP